MFLLMHIFTATTAAAFKAQQGLMAPPGAFMAAGIPPPGMMPPPLRPGMPPREWKEHFVHYYYLIIDSHDTWYETARGNIATHLRGPTLPNTHAATTNGSGYCHCRITAAYCSN